VNPLAYIPANVDSVAILHAKFFKLLQYCDLGEGYGERSEQAVACAL
jgi:hypothetical protein